MKLYEDLFLPLQEDILVFLLSFRRDSVMPSTGCVMFHSLSEAPLKPE